MASPRTAGPRRTSQTRGTVQHACGRPALRLYRVELDRDLPMPFDPSDTVNFYSLHKIPLIPKRALVLVRSGIRWPKSILSCSGCSCFSPRVFPQHRSQLWLLSLQPTVPPQHRSQCPSLARRGQEALGFPESTLNPRRRGSYRLNLLFKGLCCALLALDVSRK